MYVYLRVCIHIYIYIILYGMWFMLIFCLLMLFQNIKNSVEEKNRLELVHMHIQALDCSNPSENIVWFLTFWSHELLQEISTHYFCGGEERGQSEHQLRESNAWPFHFDNSLNGHLPFVGSNISESSFGKSSTRGAKTNGNTSQVQQWSVC